MNVALSCRLGRHATHPSNVCNQGVYFSTCSRCGRDMIGSWIKWRPIPRGKRIVWRTVWRNEPHPAPDHPVAIVRPSRWRRLRPSFAQLVPMDLKLFAWAGAEGVRQWRGKLAEELFIRLSALNGQLTLKLP